jgi:ABC-type multidrug transport system fused ATPase/permease subunit
MNYIALFCRKIAMNKNSCRFIRDILDYTDPKYNLYLLAYSFSALLTSFIVGRNIQYLLNAIQKNQYQNYLWFAGVSVGLLVVVMALRYFARFFVIRASDYLGERLYRHLFDKVTGISLSAMDRQKPGDLQSRMTFDVRTASRIYRLDLDYIAGLAFNGFGSMILIFIIKWEIGILAVLCGAAGYLVNIKFLPLIQSYSRHLSSQIGDMTDVFTQLIQGASTIRVYGIQQWLEKNFNMYNEEARKIILKLNRIETIQNLFNGILRNINTFLFLGIVLLFLAWGRLLFGDVIAAFYYSMAVVSLFTDLSLAFTNLQKSYASIARIKEVEALPVERNDGDTVIEIKETDPISFELVNFSYDRTTPILKNLSFRVKPKEFLYIKGSSGRGKSTIFKLLLALYECPHGMIRLYEKDIRFLSLDGIRNCFSYISQNPMLFRGSILENIAAVKEGATLEDVINASKKAAIHDFIDSLPAKYDTNVGENGKLLSGGQRQRIAIARVFLKDSPIILLDEPVSAADSLNAAGFYTVLAELFKEKTILLISHRDDQEFLSERFKERLRVLKI